MGNFLKNRKLLSGSSGVVLPSGGTALRPDNPAFGLIRYNTDSGLIEYFNGTVFVSLAATGGAGYVVDNFTGDGVTTVFVMSIIVDDPTQIIVFVGSVYQIATTNYTVGGPGNFNITFTSPPPDGLPINVIHTTS